MDDKGTGPAYGYELSPGTLCPLLQVMERRARPAASRKIKQTLAWGEDGGGLSRGLRIFPEAPLQAHLVDTFVGCRAIAPDDYTLAADLWMVASIERATGEKTPIVSDPPFHDQAGLAHPFFRLEGQVSGRNFSRTHFIRHQMLGPPTGPHGFSEDVGLGEDVSLFQIDSDPGLSREFSFSQGGPAHFWITRDDLAAGRFDQAYATTG